MVEVLAVIAIFAYAAAVFLILYFVGEKTFWGRVYLNHGYQILLSRRFDAYLFDTLVVWILSLLTVIWCVDGTYSFFKMGYSAVIIFGVLVLLFLLARLMGKCCVFYNEQGLLLSKPFQNIRFVPWREIGAIQSRRASAALYHVLDRSGHRLTWFPFNKETLPFFKLAQQHGIVGSIPKLP